RSSSVEPTALNLIRMGFSSIIQLSCAASISQGILTNPHSTRRFAYSWASPKSGARSRQWHVDETYLKVRGRWCYLYRAIDRDGYLVDTMLSEHRNMAAAQAFFRSAKAATGVTPERVTT